MPDKRDRSTFQTTLVRGKPLDDSILQYREEVMRDDRGGWSQAFRRAFDLYLSLLEGRKDVFQRMFPKLWMAMVEEAEAEAEAIRAIKHRNLEAVTSNDRELYQRVMGDNPIVSALKKLK